MTSARKIKANRVNAQASTGPRTLHGKSRAARNALRHGLSLSVLADPVLTEEAKNLALKIAGEGPRAEILEPAQRIAEAQIDIVRVRQARHYLLSKDLHDPEFRPLKYFKDAHALVKIIAGFMRRFGPEVVLPPPVAQHAVFFIGNRKVRKNWHTFCLISPRSSLRLIAMNGGRSRDANLPLETSMPRAV
jgi:hypothetical protein